MSDPHTRSDPPADSGERLAAYLEKASGVLSRHSVRALKADLERFVAWCAERGLNALPARSATVAEYIEAMARVRAPASVRRYVSSIASAHLAIGARNPVQHVKVKQALHRMSRRNGCRQEQVLGLTWALRQRLTAAAGTRVIDVRNRAMLAVAYDAMLRRSELVALQVADLTIEMDGTASLLVRRGKSDPDGLGALLYRTSITRVPCGRRGRALSESVSRSTAQLRSLLERRTRCAGKLDAMSGACFTLTSAWTGFRAGRSRQAWRARDAPRHSRRTAGRRRRTRAIASGIVLPAIVAEPAAGSALSPRSAQRYGERLLARRGGAAQLARLQKRD